MTRQHILTRASAAALFAAAAALAGCAGTAPPAPAPAKPGPTEHFQAEVKEVPDQLALAVHPTGLSAHQSAALSDFVARWRDAGAGAVSLKVPADADNAGDANAMTYAVRAAMLRLGVPVEAVKLASYTAGAPGGPVLASFDRLTAKGPDCSGGWDNLTSTMDNEPFKHFGCAVTANAAAQVADPRDLVTPSGLAPADNTRRLVVLGRYREGKTTSSDKDSQANGISSAVSQ